MTIVLYLLSFVLTVADSFLAGWLVDYLQEKFEGDLDSERGAALIFGATSIPAFIFVTGISDTLSYDLSALVLLIGIPLATALFFIGVVAAFYLALILVLSICYLPSLLVYACSRLRGC